MSNTKHFADLKKVCSILPALLVMPAMATPILQTVGAGETYTIKASDNAKLSDNNITGKFDGGLIYVNEGGKLNINGATFANNEFNSDNDSGWGFGNIFNKGEMDIVNAVFMNNFSTSGGAVSNSMDASDGKIAGTKFKNNHAWADGGAISSFGPLSITGSVFEGNTASFLKDESGEYTEVVTGIENPVGGGAIALGAESETIVASIDSTEFKGNKSGLNGGAIGTRLALRVDEEGNWLDDKDDPRHRNSAKLNVSATFENNSAERSGGAIYNTFYTDANSSQGKGVIVKGEFENNHAGYHGGAIYNDGDKDTTGNGAIMTVINGEFEGNKAGDSGGAIYNSGELYVNGGTFEGNHADVWGGAIYSSGQTDEYDLKMEKVEKPYRRDTAGVLEIKNATFTGNSATYAGAVAAGTSTSKTIIENTVFKNNTADEIGALGLFAEGTLKNVEFYGNKSTSVDSESDGGGALFLGAVSSTDVNGVLSDSVFSGNESATRAGAISTRTFYLGNNQDAYLDITGTTFMGNKAATNGGAIDNFFYHSVNNADAMYVTGAVFSDNRADNGGAIYNHGSTSVQNKYDSSLIQKAAIELNNSEFVENKASELGGAIYNETEANVFLSGNNTFTGNTANGVANDIHNLGTVTIASGMTSIDGGITGDGILNIEEGATLNMNYASIEQGTINLDGTLMASLLNANDTLDVSGDLAGDGRITLNVGAAGVYDLSAFKGYVDPASFGKTFDVSVEDGIATVTAKNAQAVAAATGMSMGGAGAISTLAVSTDTKLQQVSLKAQEVLNSGNTALVEKEMAKLNPDSKPVAHSVASSVQNQVVTVAAGRMSAVAGRAGGDVTAAGVWAQGLFNKSKLNGQFHGYTRGFALGGDTLIDNKYTIGGGFAFNNTDVHADGRHMDVDSTSVFVYGQYKPADWYVNATINYTMSEYADNANVLGFAFDNEYDTNAFGAQAMYGYNFASGVTPEFGLRYLHVNQEEHNDVLGRTIEEMNTDFLSGVAGVKYAFDIENDWEIQLRPELRAAMTYDLMSDDSVATIVVPGASSYYVNVDRLSRLGGEFGIGLTAEYRGLEVSLNYELDLHKDYTSQTGLLKFRYNF